MSGRFNLGKALVGFFRNAGKNARFEKAPEHGHRKLGKQRPKVYGERTKMQAHRHERELAGRAANKRRRQIALGKTHAKAVVGRTNAKRRHARNTANAIKRSGWIEAGR